MRLSARTISAAAALDHQPPRFWIVYDTGTHTYEVLDCDHVGHQPSAPVEITDGDEIQPEWDRQIRLPEHFRRGLSGMSVGDVVDLVAQSGALCAV